MSLLGVAAAPTVAAHRSRPVVAAGSSNRPTSSPSRSSNPNRGEAVSRLRTCVAYKLGKSSLVFPNTCVGMSNAVLRYRSNIRITGPH